MASCSARRVDYTAGPGPVPEEARYSLSPEVVGALVEGAGLRPVRAWVPANDGIQSRVDAVAVTSTVDAVCVRRLRDGHAFQAWVWRAAVLHRAVPAAVQAALLLLPVGS